MLTLAVLPALVSPSTAVGQEKSVRPGINQPFEDPQLNVGEFVERFEREGREVFDLRAAIVAACQIKPGATLADIGAGTGLFTRLLASETGAAGRVYAVDISPKFVAHVEKSCREAGQQNVVGVVCRQDSVELPAESIDLALLCDVYHHFEFPYKTMRSLHRALKPGGQIVLVEFHRVAGESSDWILGHVRADKQTFLREIELSGFEVAEDRDALLKTSYWVRFKKSERISDSGHTTDGLEDVRRLIKDGAAVLLDVREPTEWNSGHLRDARLAPLSELRELPGAKAGEPGLLATLPRDRIVYCHCRSGGRVLAAAKILRPLGFDIRPLQAGFGDLVQAGFEKAD